MKKSIAPVILLVLFLCAIMAFLAMNSGLVNDWLTRDDEPDTLPGGTDEGLGNEPPTSEEQLSYQLSSLEINVNAQKAFVMVESPEDCKVLLRFVTEESFFASEENKALGYYENCSAIAEVTMPKADRNDHLGVSSAEVELEISGILPEHFVAEAVIIDETGEMLSSPIYEIKHTLRYEQFQNLTPADFPETDNVIVFGDGAGTATELLSAAERRSSTTTENFGVLADGVKIITCKSLQSFIDNYDWYVYEIVSPSENIKSGDIIYVTDGKSSQLIGVFYTDTEGETVYAHPFNYARYELSKYYKFLKVDSCFTADGELEVQPLTTAQDEEEENSYERHPIEQSKKIQNFPINLIFGDAQGSNEDKAVKVEVEGKLSDGEIAVDGYYIYAPTVFGEDYFECEVRTDVDFIIAAEISVSAGSDDEYAEIPVGSVKKIGKIVFPTAVPGLLLKAEFGTSFSGKISGKIEIDSMPVFGKYGFRYSSEEGYSALGKDGGINGDKNKNYINCSAEAEIYFGPRVLVGAELLCGIVDFSADTDLTLRLSASTDSVHNYDDTDRVIHNCELCVDADFNIHFGVNLKLGCRIAKFIAYYPVQLEIISVDLNLGEFYVSLPEIDASVEFGTGDCQNYSLKYYIEPRCEAYEYFICSHLENNNDSYYWKQEEDSSNQFHLSVASSYDPATGIYGYVTEGFTTREGYHWHFFNNAYVIITDNDTGDVLFYDTLTLTRDQHNRPILKELYATIPLSVRNMHVKIVCNCTVYECEMQKWNKYNPDSLDTYESYYPERLVNHTVEYDLTHNFTIDADEQHNPWEEDKQESGSGPFGTVDLGAFISHALSWDENNKYMGYK